MASSFGVSSADWQWIAFLSGNELPAELTTRPTTPTLFNLLFELRLTVYEYVLDEFDGQIDFDPSMDRSKRCVLLRLLHICRALRNDIFNFLTVVGHFYDYVGSDKATGLVEDPRFSRRDPDHHPTEKYVTFRNKIMGHSTMAAGSCLGTNHTLRNLFLRFKKVHLQIHSMREWEWSDRHRCSVRGKILYFCASVRQDILHCGHRLERTLTIALDDCTALPVWEEYYAAVAIDLWYTVESCFQGIPRVTLRASMGKYLEFRGYRIVMHHEDDANGLRIWRTQVHDRTAWREEDLFEVTVGEMRIVGGKKVFEPIPSAKED